MEFVEFVKDLAELSRQGISVAELREAFKAQKETGASVPDTEPQTIVNNESMATEPEKASEPLPIKTQAEEELEKAKAEIERLQIANTRKATEEKPKRSTADEFADIFRDAFY